jgi:hypothetical protein
MYFTKILYIPWAFRVIMGISCRLAALVRTRRYLNNFRKAILVPTHNFVIQEKVNNTSPSSPSGCIAAV